MMETHQAIRRPNLRFHQGLANGGGETHGIRVGVEFDKMRGWFLVCVCHSNYNMNYWWLDQNMVLILYPDRDLICSNTVFFVLEFFFVQRTVATTWLMQGADVRNRAWPLPTVRAPVQAVWGTQD